MSNETKPSEVSRASGRYAIPCPFCNGQPERDTVSGDGGFFPRCEEWCVFFGHLAYIGGERCPLDIWNTRFVNGTKVVNLVVVPSAELCIYAWR